jgi:hypothetical protein
MRLAEELGDSDALARAALGFAQRPAALAADQAIVQCLRKAEARPDTERSLRARLVSRLGAELAYGGASHSTEAVALLDEGLAIARDLGDAFTLGRVLLDRTSMEFSAADTRAWLASAEEIERCGRVGRDRELEFRGLVGQVAGHLELNVRERAATALSACQRHSSEHPTQYAQCVTHGIEATFALIDGRFDDAAAAIAASESHVGGSRGLALQVLGQRFALARELDRLEEVLPALERIVTQLPGMLVATAGAGLSYSLLGKVDAAREALAAVIRGLPNLRRDWNRLPALALAAEVAFRAGAPEAAAALEPELAPYAALAAVQSNASSHFGSVEHALGWLAAARGLRREAQDHFERALRSHESLRSPPWCERTRRAIDEVKRAGPVRLVS